MGNKKKKKTVVMCPPDYFEITYEINPWMKKGNQVDKEKALVQWENLRLVYSNLGIEVKTMPPVMGLPDMVFTANGGSVFGKNFILSNFKYKARKGEEKHFENFFKKLRFKIIRLPGEMIFEGVGDSLPWDGKLFGGYGFRSSLKAQQYIADKMGLELIPLRLINPKYYHLDTALCPIDEETVVYYPKAFDKASKKRLMEAVPNLINATDQDAMIFGCNAVAMGKKIVMSAKAKGLAKTLREEGYEPILVDVSEFQKSGGSIRCLTLELN